MILAAGAVVSRRTATGVQVLLVHRPRYDDWSLPKGKQDGAEALAATARREVAEETGFDVALGPSLPSTRYVDQYGRDKAVSYWLARPVAGRFTPNDEVDACSWLTSNDAAERVTRPDDVAVVEAARRTLATTRFVVLVRHADAGDRARWSGDDARRPLSPRGRRQARALRGLSTGGVTAVLTSPAARCRETVEPLAADIGVAVVGAAALAEGAGGVAALAVLGAAVDGTVACSHGDVIGAVLEILARGAVPGVDPRRCAKGSAWVLAVDGEEVVAADYVHAA